MSLYKFKSKFSTLVLSSGLLCVLGLTAFYFSKNATTLYLNDAIDLPQGVISPPKINDEESDSITVINFQVGLGSIAKTIEALLSDKLEYEFEVPVVGKFNTSMLVKDIKIYRIDNERARVTSNVSVSVTKPSGFRIDIEGYSQADTAFAVNQNWEVEFSGPKTKLRILKPFDAPEFITNHIEAWIDEFLYKFKLPLKGCVESSWKNAQRPLLLDAPLNAAIYFKPKVALLGGVLLDEKTNSLVVGAGLKFQAHGVIGTAAEKQGDVDTSPAIVVNNQLESLSQICLPLSFEISKLAEICPKVMALGDDGSVEINKIKFSDKDGQLWMRADLIAHLPSQAGAVPIKTLKGRLVASLKVGSSKLEEIEVQDFSISSETNSLLVDHIGPTLTEAFKDSIISGINKSLRDISAGATAQLENDSNQSLINLRDSWAASSSEWGDLAKSSKPEVSCLKITPQKIRVDKGYLNITLNVESRLSLVVE